jgi:FixJ family two-component response regulator
MHVIRIVIDRPPPYETFRFWLRFLVSARNGQIASPATVFVIDDDASVRKAFHRVISLAGHAVEVFCGAEAYLRRPAPERPACLVLDIRMPGMSGLDLQRAVKGTPHDLPIVFVTGHGDAQESEQALSRGAIAVIDKPVDMAELLDAIARGLGDSLAETA